MASHSCAVTVEVAPADSAVSVVGTGVELGARADAIFRCVTRCRDVAPFVLYLVLSTSRRGWEVATERLGVGDLILRCLVQIPDAAYSGIPEHSLAPCHLFTPTVAAEQCFRS